MYITVTEKGYFLNIKLEDYNRQQIVFTNVICFRLNRLKTKYRSQKIHNKFFKTDEVRILL